MILGVLSFAWVSMARANFISETTSWGRTIVASSPTASAGGEKIKNILVNGSDGVFDHGLKWLRACIGMFLLLYGLYLGVSVAFGQAESGQIVSFFVGAMIALGAQAIAGLYTAVFKAKT